MLVLEDTYDERTPREFLMCDWAWQSVFSVVTLQGLQENLTPF